jgi:hypothetical protein
MGTLSDGVVYIPVGIGGHQLNFSVATNEQFSWINMSSASGLSLPREPITAYGLAVESTRLHDYAIADPIKLGNVSGRMRLVVVPDNYATSDVSGELSSDFLKNYDVEFDFAKNRFNLYLPDHCEGGVVYWTRDAASRVPAQISAWGVVSFDAELDGKSVRAMLATGSRESTLLVSENEAKFGDQASEWKLIKSEPHVPEWRNGHVTTYEHVFNSLSLEGIAVANPGITIKSIGWLTVKPQLYIGMDIVRQLHLYIAYKEGNLYVSAAGAH